MPTKIDLSNEGWRAIVGPVLIMKAADTELLHSLWMTFWNYLSSFKYLLSVKEVQKAIATLNKKEKHPFWGKFKEALWTLVEIPSESKVDCVHSLSDISGGPTQEWLEKSGIEIQDDLRGEFGDTQSSVHKGVSIWRSLYDAEDMVLMGLISQKFQGFAETPFDAEVDSCELSSVIDFVRDAETEGLQGRVGSVICDPSAENIFMVRGKNETLMISVRRKLTTWRMRRIRAGDNLSGEKAYLFT